MEVEVASLWQGRQLLDQGSLYPDHVFRNDVWPEFQAAVTVTEKLDSKKLV